MKKGLRKILVLCIMLLGVWCGMPKAAVLAKDLVIVLDPGHGGGEGGASRTWDGVTYREEVINQKIADYLKKELETYSGVKVYMTRNTSTPIQDRETRLKIAKNYKADVCISIHINATGDNKNTTVTGCTTCVPSFKKDPDKDIPSRTKNDTVARNLGAAIRKALNADCGLKDNGPWYDDELGIIKFGRKYNIPSLIIEHCFVSNPTDCKLYLKTNAKIKKMALADAKGIATYYGLTKKSEQKEETPVKGYWETQDGRKYYFDENNTMCTGWQLIDGNYYYFDKYGVLQTGVFNIGSDLYLSSSSGVRAVGTVKYKGKYYYASEEGKLQLGWQYFETRTCYFDKTTGAALIGLHKIDGNQYFFSTKGGMKKKWVTISGKKYYFSVIDGRLLKNYWLKYGGKWYYLNSKGTPYMSCKKKIGGVYYTFDADGVCLNKYN